MDVDLLRKLILGSIQWKFMDIQPVYQIDRVADH